MTIPIVACDRQDQFDAFGNRQFVDCFSRSGRNGLGQRKNIVSLSLAVEVVYGRIQPKGFLSEMKNKMSSHEIMVEQIVVP